MKSFTDYLTEKLNEKGSVVPVTQFFGAAPELHFQRDIEEILDLLKRGRLHPYQKTLRIADWVPTQKVVSLPKVLNKATKPDDPGHPIVILRHDASKDYIIDGHHRAAALVMRGIKSILVTIIDSHDVARRLRF